MIFDFGILHNGILFLSQISRMKSIHKKDYQRLIELLRTKRIERCFTQQQLASSLGVGQGVISKIETHERRIDIIELREICKSLGISFLEFICELDRILQTEENPVE